MTFTAVILAAGQGRRARGYKPLFPLGRGKVIDAVLEAAGGSCRSRRVVGGACFNELEAYLRPRYLDIVLLRNSSWEQGGMFSSVQVGLERQDGPVFVHPCDAPGATAAVYTRLAQAYLERPSDVAKPVFEGRGGHPVLLGPAAVRAVQSAPRGTTLRDVLRGFETTKVEMDDDAALLDFDTPAEYEALQARLGTFSR